ncbi:uncharacterized protein F5147DRAFT_763382 [Suillus discolor]|uniref:Uncharacterized protein n=1 Tax=Suillus discolor TaxID=1912936 RepID=A0A9P7JQ26_9AGAM|nr:uncharacterized protein F5147DRAFT_763382 [Suillus discolor]KAG2097548.1 hypothetical protein F5147DRAFT_763382 [Suillus discolor]
MLNLILDTTTADDTHSNIYYRHSFRLFSLRLTTLVSFYYQHSFGNLFSLRLTTLASFYHRHSFRIFALFVLVQCIFYMVIGLSLLHAGRGHRILPWCSVYLTYGWILWEGSWK